MLQVCICCCLAAASRATKKIPSMPIAVTFLVLSFFCLGVINGFQIQSSPLPTGVKKSSTTLWSSPLSLDNSLTTVITLYPTKDAEQQQTLLEKLKISLLPKVKEHKGFVCTHFHTSLDGVKLATYEQWQNLEDFQDFLETINDDKETMSLLAGVDRHVYEIVASQSNLNPPDTPVAVDEKYPLVHFAEFRLQPENQPRMIELAKANLGPAMKTKGLLTATFHKSTDGLRVINYGQWENEEAIESLKKQPGFGTGTPYWDGIAENEHHLYKLVSSHENEK